jgi:hypothetical protein
VPTARCTRSGMCSRRSMATIASRSSSDRVRGITASGRAGRGPSTANSPLGRGGAAAAEPGASRAAPGGELLSQAGAARPSRGKYLIKLKNRVREVAAACRASAAARCRGDRARPRRLQAYSPRRQPAVDPGVRVFACAALGCFEVLPLPVVSPLPARGGRDAAGARARVGGGRVRAGC